MNLFKYLLGLALHVANSRPPILSEKVFYEMKTALLHRFGTADGYDVQRITKSCYACDGSGVYKHSYYGRMRCNRCQHGVWKDSLIKLDRWLLGGFAFHEPVDRIEFAANQWWLPTSADGKFNPNGYITGYVQHKSRGHYPSECAYILFLIFRPRVFVATFGHCGHGRPRTPLCFIASLIFWYRMQVHRLDQWHLNPYDSDGSWKGTLCGTCQAYEIERINDRLGANRRRRKWEQSDIPF